MIFALKTTKFMDAFYMHQTRANKAVYRSRENEKNAEEPSSTRAKAEIRL